MTPASAAAWVWEQAKKPRGRFLFWPVIIVALVVAFGLGTLAGPERVEEKTSYVEVRSKVRAEKKQTQRATYTKTVKLPDGTVTTERSTTATAKSEATEVTATSVADVRERTTTRAPDWRLGVLIGAAFQPDPLLLRPVVGAVVERRILGPFSLTAWGIVEIPAAGAPVRGAAGLGAVVDL